MEGTARLRFLCGKRSSPHLFETDCVGVGNKNFGRQKRLHTHRTNQHLCTMPLVTDQLSRSVAIKNNPKRIVSVVPSQTELLFHLGLHDNVIGITKFCVHPQEWFRTKTRVGGTKTLNIEKIKSLQPDLIIANKEENLREQVDQLAMDCPVWISDVNTLNDALTMITSVGDVTGKKKEAQTIASSIADAFARLAKPSPPLRTAYLIWREPYMTVGGDTFINDMLDKAGFENVFHHRKRYPVLSLDDLQYEDADVLLLSSEPYPFKQKHADELKRFLAPTKILFVDGEMFSWYGSRLQQAPAYFAKLRRQIEAMA